MEKPKELVIENENERLTIDITNDGIKEKPTATIAVSNGFNNCLWNFDDDEENDEEDEYQFAGIELSLQQVKSLICTLKQIETYLEQRGA